MTSKRSKDEVIINQYNKNEPNKDIRVELYPTEEEAVQRAQRLRETCNVLGVTEAGAQRYNIAYTYTKR